MDRKKKEDCGSILHRRLAGCLLQGRTQYLVVERTKPWEESSFLTPLVSPRRMLWMWLSCTSRSLWLPCRRQLPQRLPDVQARL